MFRFCATCSWSSLSSVLCRGRYSADMAADQTLGLWDWDALADSSRGRIAPEDEDGDNVALSGLVSLLC